MSSSYDRGRRGAHNSGGGRDRDRDYDRRERNDSQDRKRPRDECQGRKPPRGKFQKRGGLGRGRGRKEPEREFQSVIVTKPVSLVSKTVDLNDHRVQADTKIQLVTNYFRVETKKKISMAQYRIDFYPTVDDKRRKDAVINECNNLLGIHVYDGANIVFLMRKLSDSIVKTTVKLRDGSQFNVTFKYTREICYTDAEFFRILNLIIRRCFNALNLTLIGRNYYDAAAAKLVRELRIALWPGYITSIRQHEESVLLCCEPTYKMMRPSNIWEIIKELGHIRGGAYRDEAARQIIGNTVFTTYNNAKYRINDIDWKSKLGDSHFPINGKEISTMQYYQEHYNIGNLDPNQPLLITKAKAKNIRGGSGDNIFLVPQLCQATGLDDSMRNNFQMMRQLSQYTRMTPAERISKLTDFRGRQDNPQCRAIFKDNHLDLSRELVTVEARRIAPQSVFFGNNTSQLHDNVRNTADWTNSLETMYKCMPLKRWVFICTKRCKSDSLAFLELLDSAARQLGMEVDICTKEIIPDDRNQTYMNALEKHIKMDPLLIVVVVENNKSDRYAAIKKKCFLNNPVPVQVLNWKTFAESKRGTGSVAKKVAIQINCKLGGIPWLINIPIPLKNGMLVIGFDVTHDSENKFKSVGAMVASLNPQKDGGKFFSSAKSHENGEQISKFFGLQVAIAIKKYKQLNEDALPDRIIIYRDGVGDGQIEYVKKCEVDDIISKVSNIYKSDPKWDSKIEPKIAFIIVNKRINTRFFVRSGPQGRPENPLPGTVCDSVVTLPERYDFYLISQSVTQGTVAPVSYNIIHDTTGLLPCHMQQLTFKLCHTYYNWSGTTRVPSVVQYAKKLSLFIGQYLHQEPTGFKDDQMLYFL